MITIIDNDLGNIGSVVRAVSYLNIPFCLTRDLNEIEKAEKLILPGVGSFSAAAKEVLTPQFTGLIRYLTLEKGIPFFGFCLGMQLISEFGEEMGESKGLGLIKAKTSRLRVDPARYPVPHMGWNDVDFNGLKMFAGVADKSCFYFVHSFEMMVSDPETNIATVNYGDFDICAAVEKDNIWGAQFHPEKSQKAGLQLIKNFSLL